MVHISNGHNENFIRRVGDFVKDILTPEPKIDKIFNEAGQVIEVTKTKYGVFRRVNSIFTYEYNEAGQETKYIADYNADKKPDYIETYEYNEAGDCTKYVRDYDGDGTPDYISTNEYNEAGIRQTADFNADGIIDEITDIPYYDPNAKDIGL